MTEKLFTHPETGEILETHEDIVKALRAVDERLAPLYRVRRALREEMADRFPPPELPGRRERTAVQDKVARCPRCGGKLESEEPPK